MLLAYAKLDLDAEIIASPLPDDAALADLLTGYFPPAATAAFPGEAERHRLRREIVSTILANRMINLAGPVFGLRMRELSGLGAADVARGLRYRRWGPSAFGAQGAHRCAGRQGAGGGADQGPMPRSPRICSASRPGSSPMAQGAHVQGALAETIARYRAGVEALRGHIGTDHRNAV